MSKSPNQRLIALYILEFLRENTNEDHSVNANDIIEFLAGKDINVERKTVYAYIKEFEAAGYDIIPPKDGGYKLAEAFFETSELDILVDAVLASKFITEKKSDKLIKKLSGFINKFDRERFNRKVIISDRVKNENESIYIVIDLIHSAINQNKTLEFEYGVWGLDKKLHPKHDGKRYHVTVKAVTWDDENYYMIAYDEDEMKVKHFRVDKLMNVAVTEKKGCPKTVFAGVDVAKMAKKTFGMYHGQPRKVVLTGKNEIVGVVIDRFGSDIIVVNNGDGTFSVNQEIEVSPQFFGWVAGMAGNLTVSGPDDVAKEYNDHLKKALKGIL